jgi:hypothetical protein
MLDFFNFFLHQVRPFGWHGPRARRHGISASFVHRIVPWPMVTCDMSDDDSMSDVHEESSSAKSNSMEKHLQQTALVALREKEQLEAQAGQADEEEARCYQKSVHYMDRSTEAQERAKRLRVEAVEAQRMHDSLQFDALCRTLRRNDPTKTAIRCADFPVGYAQRLGEALRDNTHVSSIEVDLRQMVPPFIGLQQISSFVAPLLRYIRSAKALRSFSISSDNDEDDASSRVLVKEILEALFEKQAGIDKITSHTSVPIKILINAIQSSSGLDIRLGYASSREERRAISYAFRSSISSLVNLRIDCDSASVITAILTGLKASNSKLQELTLCCESCRDACWVALSEFTHATTFLTHLQVEEQEFDEEQMGSFLHCLKNQSSISKLSLVECSMDSDAMHLLKRFMRTRKEGDALGVSSLRDLVLDSVDIDPHGTTFRPGSLFASMFWSRRISQERRESQLPPNTKELRSTIGSHIRSLSLGPVDGGFVRALARNAHRLALTSLSVCVLDLEDCMHLAQCISKNLSLQEMKIDCMDVVEEDRYPILWSLRSNGTLQTVTIDGEVESMCTNSFCLRNKLLGQMLRDLTVNHRSAAPFLPSLLECAKQVSATRASTVLSTLVNLGGFVGPIEGKAGK